MKKTIISGIKRLTVTYPASLLLLVLMIVTRPFYYADSYEYAHTIMAQEAGKNPSLFLDAGHILWRPLGMVVHLLFNPILQILFPQGEFARVSASLIFLVVLFSIWGTVYFYRLLRTFPISERAVQATMVLYVVSICILNYSQTGTSYMAGLSVLMMGMYYSFRASRTRSLVVSGIALGTSVFFWMPYILALPAAILARPMLYGWNRQRILESSKVIAGCILIAVAILFPIIGYLHLYSLQLFLTWMIRSSLNHQASGISRTFFGLTRILFFSGSTTLFVKRYLFHDPYYPVSLGCLILQLWEVGVFYMLALVATVTLVKKPSFRNYLPWIALGIVPNIILSMRWDGAALERHLPLLPFFFLSLAFWFEVSSEKVRAFFLGVIGIVAFVNITNLWYISNASQEKQLDRELVEIQTHHTPASMIAIISSHVPLAEFQGVHPFDTLNQLEDFQFYAVVQQGFDSARFWRQSFENTIQQCWRHGENVWISKALLANEPGEYTYWIEHSDPGVFWKDVSNYFQGLKYIDSTKDFYLLKNS